MNKYILICIPLFSLFLITGCVPSGDPMTETYNVAYEDISTIDLDLSSSDLVIRLEDRNDIYIDYYTYENGPELVIREGNTLRISEAMDWPFYINFNDATELILYLPEQYNETLKINTSSGSIYAESLRLKDIEVKVSSGEIDFHDIESEDMVFTLSSGDLHLETVTSDTITIQTSSGHVKLIDVIGEVSGRSSSGRVTVELASINHDFTYNLSSGDFRMKLDDAPKSADFNLGCSSGDVDLEFELDDYDKDEDNKVKGRIGDGKIDIDIHTSSGDIEIY